MESIVRPGDPAPHTPKRQRRISKAAIAAVAAVLLVTNLFLYAKMKRVEIASENREELLSEQLSRLEENLARQNHRSQQIIRQLEAQVNQARLWAGDTAKAEAKRHSDRVAKAITENQREQIEAVTAQLQALHSGSSSVATQLSDVGHEVHGVKSSFEQARSDLDQTSKGLAATETRLVALDGRLAANASKMDELERRAMRESVPFQLAKQPAMSRFGGLRMRLTKTDSKRGKFSIEVLVDDRKLVKKDRQIHEPILLYLDGGRQPHEIVITRILKDEVAGYVSIPYSALARH
jgi:hypothetical protein